MKRFPLSPLASIFSLFHRWGKMWKKKWKKWKIHSPPIPFFKGAEILFSSLELIQVKTKSFIKSYHPLQFVVPSFSPKFEVRIGVRGLRNKSFIKASFFDLVQKSLIANIQFIGCLLAVPIRHF